MGNSIEKATQQAQQDNGALNLEGRNVSPKHLLQLKRAMIKSKLAREKYPELSDIYTLELGQNPISDDGAVIVGDIISEENNSVTRLDLTQACIGDTGAAAIAIALAKPHCRLKVLAISSFGHGVYNVGNRGAIAIFEALSPQAVNPPTSASLPIRSSTLIELNLSRNSIGDDAAYSIARMINSNQTLLALDLSHNTFSDVGIAIIAEAMQGNKSITHFSLALNTGSLAAHFSPVDQESIFRGAQAIARMLAVNLTLTSLSVANNKYGDAELLLLAKALGNTAGGYAAQQDGSRDESRSSQLHKLCALHNQLSIESAVSFFNSLRGNIALTELDLSYCGVHRTLDSSGKVGTSIESFNRERHMHGVDALIVEGY